MYLLFLLICINDIYSHLSAMGLNNTSLLKMYYLRLVLAYLYEHICST